MRALCRSHVPRIRQMTIAAVLILTVTACGGGAGKGGDSTIPETVDRPTVIDAPSTFDGRSVILSVGRGQTVNTADHFYTASTPPVLHTPEYSGRESLVLTNTRLTSLVHATWNTQDQADYVTFGAWAEQSASNAGSPLSPVATGVVFDGPRIPTYHTPLCFLRACDLSRQGNGGLQEHCHPRY